MIEKTEQFRYKNYTFTFNPRTFQINQKRRLCTFPILNQTDLIQEHGNFPMEIRGEGELIGENLMEEYQKLYELFLSKESGLLYLPNLTPFYCFFEHLNVIGRAGPRVLSYQFTFRQDTSKDSAALTAQRNYYRAQEGDTLVLISVKCGVDLEVLKEKNPQLAGNIELEEGVTVWLS